MSETVSTHASPTRLPPRTTTGDAYSLECPYCGHIIKDLWDLGIEDELVTCSGCARRLDIEVEERVHVTARRPPYVTPSTTTRDLVVLALDTCDQCNLILIYAHDLKGTPEEAIWTDERGNDHCPKLESQARTRYHFPRLTATENGWQREGPIPEHLGGHHITTHSSHSDTRICMKCGDRHRSNVRNGRSLIEFEVCSYNKAKLPKPHTKEARARESAPEL